MPQKFLIVILLFSVVGFAQQAHQLNGKILADTLAVHTVHILNKTKNIGVINDQNGHFSIWADPGDIIIFSSVQFMRKEIMVTQDYLESENFEIWLEPSVNQLEEVVLSSHFLSGDINKDVSDIPTYTQQLPFWNAAELKAMGVSGFNDAQSSVRNLALQNSNNNVAGVSFDLKLLVKSISNIFSKRKEIGINIEKTDFFDQKIIIEQLDIPDNQYYNFIDFVNEQPETSLVLETKDGLRILEFLLDQRDVFMKKYQIKK